MDKRNFEVSADQNVILGFRPNHMSTTTKAMADFSVHVHSIEQLGGESFLYCRTQDATAVTAHIAGQTNISAGAEIGIKIDGSSFHLFDAKTDNSLKTSAG